MARRGVAGLRLMKTKCFESGRKCGHRCEVSSRTASSLVTATASPPFALMRKSGPPLLGANTMTPADPQVPPRGSDTAASSRGSPPARSMRWSFESAKNATARPSGEKNGSDAP